VRQPPPPPGEQRKQVLSGLLGYATGEIARLVGWEGLSKIETTNSDREAGRTR
jgi:hypothetical protein